MQIKNKIISLLLDVDILNQRSLGYFAGCEIISCAMLVKYFDNNLDITKFVSEMPYDDDPNKGFVGSLDATKSGFSIFPPALLDLIKKYIGSASNISGCNLQDLKSKINLFSPVVIWLSSFLNFRVHAICLTGYNQQGFFYNDPWTGCKNSFISFEEFEIAWHKDIYFARKNIYCPNTMALSI